ncbi:MAG: caspase family protein [Proteobacteria bacterium]|nr:caspase family protein [Pseudomonadota bacterium]
MHAVFGKFAGCVLATLFATVAAAWPAQAQKRAALVIGNDAYQNVPPLRKAANDARTMGDTLKKLGFGVLYGENLTRRDMADKLITFDRMVEPGTVAFFFFAGHGFEVKGENYLLPVDVPPAREGQEELVRDSAVAAQRIIDRLQARGARTAILILDACRDNPFERKGTRAVAGVGGLAAMTPPEGVFVVFSAGAKQTALDRLSDADANPNSVFTRTFAKELATPGLTLVQIAKRVQSNVKNLATSVNHYQTPAYYDQIVGDVVLIGTPADAPAGASLPIGPVAALPSAPLAARPQPTPNPSEPTNAPIANFSRHNSGWTVSLSFAEPTTVISYRLGDAGNFRETGFLDVLDAQTRKRMANPSFSLDADQGPTTIYVRYVDRRGEEVGPFPINFDPMGALVRDQRKILEMTASSWLSFREFNGLLVYYTHLVSNRCAIREARIGLDSSLPDRVLKLPPCDLRDPSAIPAGAQLYLKLAPTTRSISVELTFRDGSQSEIKTFRR